MRKIKHLFVWGFLLSTTFTFLSAQDPFSWTTTKDGIFRNGEPFFLCGQSWAKKTQFTFEKGAGAEAEVKKRLSELHEIGVNTIRIYGSPDQSSWQGSSNYGNLIKWIEEWNIENPDNGDPNKAIYYMVQISPKDPQSSISNNLPENSAASFKRAINDQANPGSVSRLIQSIDNISGGSRYLLAYLIYHELNVSSSYLAWFERIGAEGIENFMNAVADSIHNNYAPGKLVSHTGDAKEPDPDIYESIEALDQTKGNVFESMDLLGFNLYISTAYLLEENAYYNRIVNRRSLSVNSKRGWYIGETGASYDREADPNSVAAANYTNPQGGANLQLMWQKSKALGNMMGFMLFTVQDNDLLELENSDAMKQRGYYDFYGDKKFLYYIYPDIVNEISTNERLHFSDAHSLGVTVLEENNSFTITFHFKNRSDSTLQFFWSIHGDDGSSKQRFSMKIEQEYLYLFAGEEKEIIKSVSKPTGNDLFAICASVIKEHTPVNQYFWGREHILDDAIATVAGLNLNPGNLPEKPLSARSPFIHENQDVLNGLLFYANKQVLTVPDGDWELLLYSLCGSLLYARTISSSGHLEFQKLLPDVKQDMTIYTLKRLR